MEALVVVAAPVRHCAPRASCLGLARAAGHDVASARDDALHALIEGHARAAPAGGPVIDVDHARGAHRHAAQVRRRGAYYHAAALNDDVLGGVVRAGGGPVVGAHGAGRRGRAKPNPLCAKRVGQRPLELCRLAKRVIRPLQRDIPAHELFYAQRAKLHAHAVAVARAQRAGDLWPVLADRPRLPPGPLGERLYLGPRRARVAQARDPVRAPAEHVYGALVELCERDGHLAPAGPPAAEVNLDCPANAPNAVLAL